MFCLSYTDPLVILYRVEFNVEKQTVYIKNDSNNMIQLSPTSNAITEVIKFSWRLELVLCVLIIFTRLGGELNKEI